MVVASAPGKCILFGEHAVVYGEPAVAVAIDARVSVALEPCQGYWKLDGAPLDERHPHARFLHSQLVGDDSEPHSLMVNSELFPAAGLGSSAALSAAISAALMHRDGDGSGELDLERISHLAHMAEAEAQSGRASPTDTSTATLGGCVLVSDKREESAEWRWRRTLDTPEGERRWEIHSVSLPESVRQAHLVVGSTGIHSPTGEMVAKIARMLERLPDRMDEITRMGDLSRAGASALASGELAEVGRLMDEAHDLLAGLGVSCPELDQLVTAARPTSLGAKLTGAGGGGCMLALTTEPEATAEAIEMRGGRVITTPLGAPGVRIEP